MSSTAAANSEENNYRDNGQVKSKGDVSSQNKEYEATLWDLLTAKKLSQASNTDTGNANAGACVAAVSGTSTTATSGSSNICGSKNGSDHHFGKETAVKKRTGKQQTLITSYSSSSSRKNQLTQDATMATPTSRRSSAGGEGTATFESRRSPLVAKVYGQNDEGWHYKIALPSSVKASDIVNVRIPLPLGSERIVSVKCPPSLPPAKHNKRRSLMVVVLPKLATQLDKTSVIDLASENVKIDNEVPVPGNHVEAVDFQLEWKGMDSGGSNYNEEPKNTTHGTPTNNIGKPMTQPIITPLQSSHVKYSATTSPSTYMEMAHFAMANLKDRNGSSIPSLLKYITTNFSHKLDGKKNIKFHLTNALKSGVKSGRFVRLRNSFKLDSDWVKRERAKKIAALKHNPVGKKPSSESKISSDETMADEAKHMAVQKKREEEQRVAAEVERIEKLRRERSRKFPMDDLQLILEDNELGTYSIVPPRPVLPPAFHPLKPETVEDILQIYHVLFGDVNFVGLTDQDEELPRYPRFSLKQLGYAFLEVERGNAKRAKCLPPLLLHLLTTTIRKLLSTSDDCVPKKDATSDSIYRDVGDMDKAIDRQKVDFESLNDALTPSSCGEIIRLYMELMDRLALERYPSGYLQEEGECGDDKANNSFFFGYLGPPSGKLHTLVKKLASYDIWCLDSEDIACLLKSMCDDLMQRKCCISNSIMKCGEQVNDLLKAKKATEAQFRKIKLAFEGPKISKKKGAKRSVEKEKAVGASNVEREAEDEVENKLAEKPPITLDEVESAKLAMEKAASEYSKGLRQFLSRSEPIGYDRDHNAVYLFTSDPTILFIETHHSSSASPILANFKTPRWYAIESTSMYDGFFSSLDRRGIRENDLYENLMIEDARKNLMDDLKQSEELRLAQRHVQDLENRLESLRLAVQAEEEMGRRSGRLTSIAQTELTNAESEMQSALAEIELISQSHSTPCYQSLTGFDVLCDYDIAFMKSSLKNLPNVKVCFKSKEIPKHIAGLRGSQHAVTPLWKAGGVVDVLSSELVELESWISSLAPKGISAPSQLNWKGITNEWKQITSRLIGPTKQDDNVGQNNFSGHASELENRPTPLKRNCEKFSNLSSESKELEELQESSARVLESFKVYLLELEETMREISGLRHTAMLDDLASSIESDVEDSSCEDSLRQTWKIHVEKLNAIDSRNHASVRHSLIDAITAARESGQQKVVGELRNALKKIRQSASGAAKAAALDVLSRHGGCQLHDKSQVEDFDVDDDAASNSGSASIDEVCFLSEDAAALGACIDGNNDASRDDWVDAVKSCKTVARLSALLQTFLHKAMEVLGQLEDGQDSFGRSLTLWKKQGVTPEKRVTRNAGNKKSSQVSKKIKVESEEEETFFWINCRRTTDIVFAKLPGRPWWPACICHPHDLKVAQDLAGVNRVLLCFVGCEDLYAVRKKDTKEYKPDKKETNVTEYDRNIVAKYRNSVSLARQIYRAKQKVKGSDL